MTPKPSTANPVGRSPWPDRARGPDAGDHDTLGIDAASSTLLDPSTPLAELKQACDIFHARCLAHLPALGNAPAQLDAGIALSPADAARCVQDPLRTAQFLQGVDAAIRTRLAQAPTTPVEVLYAGCGPIAPLALLLARRYRERGVRFTLVDVHAESLTAAMRLFALAGAAGCVQDAICGDATRLRLRSDATFNILVAELMQRALSREPQLAVLGNLLPQCAHDAILVPARVAVSACLARIAVEHGREDERERLQLGELIDVSTPTLPTLIASMHARTEALPEVVLRIPARTPPGLDLMLRTRIETAAGLMLADYDSGLTCPQLLAAIGLLAAGDRIGLSYRMGRDPGFVVRRVGGERRHD